MKKGKTALQTLLKDIWAISETTNNPSPTGGVNRPMSKLRTITTPKCTGSMLNLTRMGITIGAIIISKGVGSNMHPAINKKTLRITRTIQVSEVTFISQSQASWGRFSMVRIQEKIEALQNIQTMDAVFTAETLRTSKV